MPQYLPLPDGSSVTIREGESPQQAWARAQQMYPEAFGVQPQTQAQQPQGGFVPALKSGISGLKSDVAALAGRTGLMNEAEAEKYIKEQEAYRKKTFKPTEEGWTEAPFTKTKELLGGSLPYMAAPLAAGFLAPEGAAAIGAAGLASLGQFTGSNISRQMEEGKKLGETNLGYAAAAAVPQAALDMVSFRMAPGIRNLFAVAGKEVPEKAAIEIAKQGTAQIAKDYALATGKAMSAEGLTEAGQQFFERMQAGLNLTDEKARDEYWQSLVGGAVLGGALAPAGRYVERGQQQRREEEEAAKKRVEQARAEKEAEDLKRASPDYLLQFAKDYEDRQAKFKEQKAALKKPANDATPEEQYDYRERKAALEDLRKGLFADTPEYKRVKPLVEQVQEQQRVEKLSPEEYMLEQTMQGGRGAAPAPTGGRMKGALGINEVLEAPKPDTRIADYAAGQIEAARSAGYLGLDDYADYLMQDPKMAADMLKQRPALPGLNKTDQNILYGGLKLRLKKQEKKAQAESKAELAQRKAELAQRTEDYKTQQLTTKPDPLERYLESEQQVEEHRATAETNFDYLNDMFTSAMGGQEPTIEINNQIKATADSVRKAPQTRERVESLLQEADQADTDYANALKSKEPAAAKTAFERGNAAIERINSMARDGGPYAQEVLKLRQQQNNALNKLEEIADKLRRGETLGKNEMAASTTQSLTNEAARMRSQFIQAALKEAATHRRAEGKPELTKDEAIKAASDMYDTLNEWIDRVQKEPKRDTMEAVLAEPAQMRAHKLIRQARYEQRRVFDERPLEEYRFGAYPQAVAVLKEQLDKTRRDLYTTPSEVTRETPILKQQFATTEAEKVAEARGEKATTLGGELRRRTEFVRDKMANLKPMRPAARDALNKAADVMDEGKATRDLLDTVEAVVDANINGRDIKQVDIRAINDALAATAPTATEQKEAGQKALFPETETDIGYIRMSPKNFANSPKIREAWEAIDAARAAAKRKADKEQKVAARSKAMAETVRRIENSIDLLKKDTKFFWTDTTKWTNKQVAQAAIEYPEIGNTPEENVLVDKYLKKAALTPEESQKVLTLIRDFNSNKKLEYQKRLAEAEKLVAQGERLDDLDNQLLRTMQDTNKSVRDSAEKLRKELAPLKIAIDHIKDAARKNVKDTPLMRQIRALEAKADKTRSAYRQRVEEMYNTAYKNMDDALAEILDPEIAKAQAGLKQAAETLEKEKAELERVQKHVQEIITSDRKFEQKAEKLNNEQRLMYQQFRYEEKKSIIEDLEKKIQEQEQYLADMMETREEAHDTAAAVLQAISDKKTQNIFEKVVALETQLATLRGEEVTATTGAGGKSQLPEYKYPFAQQKLDNALKAARAQLEASRKEQKATDDKIKSSKEQVKKQTAEFGVSVTRRKLNKKEREDLEKAEADLITAEKKQTELRKQLNEKLSKKERKALEADLDQTELAINQLLNTRLRLQTQIKPLELGRLEKGTDVKALLEQKELDKLAKQSRQQADQADEARRRAEIKELQLQQIDEEVGDLVSELGAYAHLPDDSDTLRQLSEDENTRPKQRNEAIAKLGVLQNIESLEAQRAAIEEGKPRRKQTAATTETSLAQSARKAFRTGDAEAQAEREYQQMSREEQRQANIAAQEARGKKAEAAPTPSTRRQGKLPDENIGLFDDYEFSRGTAKNPLTAKTLQAELDKVVGGKGITQSKVSVFDSIEDFYAKTPNALDDYPDLPADAKAFVDPKTGKAFMFANNIGKGEGLGVFLHEVGAHLGFRNLFNTAQYNALVKTVQNWANRTDNSLEARIAKSAKKRVEAAKTSKEQYNDELLAYAVEEAIQAGVKPSALRNGSPIQNWLASVLDTLKRALAAFGINPKTMTAGDLVNMAYGAAQLEVRGTWHGSDATFKAFDTKYAGTGEGAFDFRFVDENSLGAGPYTTPDKEYAEYYQHAVPFGKAANETGYGFRSYQDYRSNDAKYMEKTKIDSVADFQNVYENNLLTEYLSSVSAGGELDPAKNRAAQFYVNKLVKNFTKDVEDAQNTLASREKRKAKPASIENAQAELKIANNRLKAAQTLDVTKIKGLTERPQKGYLYRSLDAIPREKVFSINSAMKIGDRPKIDALYKNYGQTLITTEEGDVVDINAEGNEYNANSMFYKMRRDLGIEKTIKLLKDAGIEAIEQKNDRKYIERAYIDQAPEILAVDLNPVGPAKGLLFSRNATYVNDEMRAVGALADKFVAQQKTVKERVQAASGGFLGLETQFVDRFAGFERLSKVMDALKGSQMMYYLRMFDQRMNFVSQAVANGALKRVEKTRADGSKEYVIESNDGASIRGVVETLRDAKQYVGNGEAVNRLFTMYMSGIRAKNKGFAALNFGKEVSEADLKEAMRAVENNKPLKDIFDDARKQYNEYNRDMLQFVADSGAISEATRKALIQEDDYIPWYRERNGVAELVIGKETPIRIGSIAEQPYLHELVGGDRPILDFMTSAVQNTNMLADMGLRNTATKNAVFELVDMKLAKIVGASSGPNIVKFKKDGKDMYASIETDKEGIPADILVKGMEGIPTQMPAIWRLMAMPSQLLRKAVTLSPLYAAKQLFRDSLAAPILSGANFTPVLGALKEVNSATKKTLERRGVTGGQVFTGTSEDLTKILRDITEGKPGWMNLLAKAEALNMEADATTRRAQYNSYIEQGLSEMEATLMSLESMNFNKRGASPSVHIVGALIPFFNAQIQALNVLYKSFTGKMPFNERLKIQQKLLQRGGLLAAATLAYAAAMQDDEAYKNATPEQKYGNWFVRIPGVDEPVRIPVPFEIGYIFKAIPEALFNSMTNEHGDEEAVKAFKQILLQTLPGGTSYGIPQAAKPLIEYGLEKSFYTGRDILSAHEKSLLPEEQFRTNTSEAAKMLGRATGLSPIKLEELVKGYTGTMGLAFLQAVSLGIPKGNTPEQAAARLSDLPLVGGAFQPNDAAGIINATYDRFEDAIKLQRTVDSMFNEGRAAEGMALLEANMNEYMAGEMGDFFTTQMKELTQLERAIQAMDISPEEKRRRLSEVRQLKITVAASSRRAVDEIAPQ